MQQTYQYQLTLFAEDTLASPSVLPGSEQARRMTVTSGQKCFALCKKSGRIGSLQRMLLGTSTWASTKCFLTWKVKATKQQRLLFRLAPSMPRTGGIECGLWRTPSRQEPGADVARLITREGYPARKGRVDLQTAISLYPTPTTVNDSKNFGSKSQMNRSSLALNCIVALWPTPSSNGVTGGCSGLAGGSGNRLKLYKMLGKEEGKKMGCQSLNPYWVEWLMGFPIGWTDLKLSATQSFPKSSK